jgi:uncharacterized repeat protein (TIGR04138 family)
MRETAFMEIVKQIHEKDPQYDIEAYLFVREALDYTIKMLQKPDKGSDRHVSGRELLEGLRRYAIEEFGPIALKTLEIWGITKTDDIGAIVFNLVQAGEFGKTDEDKSEDFANGYDFHDAFAKPFLPATPPDDTSTPAGTRPKKRS